jgi:hypothetical protein
VIAAVAVTATIGCGAFGLVMAVDDHMIGGAAACVALVAASGAAMMLLLGARGDLRRSVPGAAPSPGPPDAIQLRIASIRARAGPLTAAVLRL